MGCNCGKRKMAQMTSVNVASGTEPADEGQVEAMVAGASSAERHNARVRIATGDHPERPAR